MADTVSVQYLSSIFQNLILNLRCSAGASISVLLHELAIDCELSWWLQSCVSPNVDKRNVGRAEHDHERRRKDYLPHQRRASIDFRFAVACTVLKQGHGVYELACVRYQSSMWLSPTRPLSQKFLHCQELLVTLFEDSDVEHHQGSELSALASIHGMKLYHLQKLLLLISMWTDEP